MYNYRGKKQATTIKMRKSACSYYLGCFRSFRLLGLTDWCQITFSIETVFWETAPVSSSRYAVYCTMAQICTLQHINMLGATFTVTTVCTYQCC